MMQRNDIKSDAFLEVRTCRTNDGERISAPACSFSVSFIVVGVKGNNTDDAIPPPGQLLPPGPFSAPLRSY